MKRGIIATIFTFTGALAAPALAAQVVGDTLRYHETTARTMTVDMAGGMDMSTEFRQEGTIAFWQISEDSAHAWYEGLSVTMSHPMGEMEFDMSALEGQHFILRIDDRGRVTTLQAPDIAPLAKGIPLTSLEFHNFFPVRPGGVLAIGVAWADTMVAVEDSAGFKGEIRDAISYEVMTDTVFDGVPAFVLDSQGSMSMATPGPVQAMPGMTMDMAANGPHQTRFIVAKDDGRLLLRTRTGEFSGSVKSTGERTMEMTIEQKETSEIRLVSDE